MSALGPRGDWLYTVKSHVMEPVWNVAPRSTCRLEICGKLAQAAVGEGGDAKDIVYDLGMGRAWAKTTDAC